MIHCYEIVGQVQERFRGLPDKLARLFGKSDDWWRSHRYKPRKMSPDAGGSTSAADHYMEMAEQYEAACPGSGQMLSEYVYLELKQRFDDTAPISTQKDIRRSVIKQCTDVALALDEKAMHEATEADLDRWETEVGEADDAISSARARIRAERRKRMVSRANVRRMG